MVKDRSWESHFGNCRLVTKRLPRRGPVPWWAGLSSQPCLGWASGSLSVSWTINAMHWSSTVVAIFLC